MTFELDLTELPKGVSLKGVRASHRPMRSRIPQGQIAEHGWTQISILRQNRIATVLVVTNERHPAERGNAAQTSIRMNRRRHLIGAWEDPESEKDERRL